MNTFDFGKAPRPDGLVASVSTRQAGPEMQELITLRSPGDSLFHNPATTCPACMVHPADIAVDGSREAAGRGWLPGWC